MGFLDNIVRKIGNLCTVPEGEGSSLEIRHRVLQDVTGTQISKYYKLKCELGRGNCGITYLCKNRTTGAKFACKTIPKYLLTTKIETDAVRREVGLLRYLPPHPNIIALKDVFEDNKNVYIVTELCKGGELSDRLVSKRHFEEKEAANIVKTIVQTVKFCHDYGVTHRDLKPQNFLLSDKTKNANLKLIDFGFASPFIPDQKFTEIVGSMYFMAPEVLKQSYGPEADLWSVGIILYNLLSGSLPFNGSNERALVVQIMNAPLRFDQGPWLAISKYAKDLIKKLLNRDPKKRPTAQKVLGHRWFKYAAECDDI